MMDISIVIVNYNVKQYILKCLDSIFKSETKQIKLEVFVVDNNSSDDSVFEIKKKYPSVLLIENKENLGFPAANNQAFRLAKGKYILMLNPDAELFENTLYGLFQFMELNENTDFIAPKLLNTDGTFQQSVWRYPSLWSVFCEMHYLTFLLKKKNYNDKDLNANFLAESFSGAAMFFKKNIFDKMGMLDESMFWIEDVEFCYRANKNNFKLMYVPEFQVIHHIGKSAKKNYNVSISNQIFNKIKFFNKYKNRIQYFIIFFLSIYHCLLKLLLFSILGLFKKLYFLKSKAYLYTLKKLFKNSLN